MAEIKDLVIGAASGYAWHQIQYWVNSLRKTRFDGDVVLVGTNMKKATIDRLTKEGIQLSLYGKKNEAGDIEAPRNNAPHVERFFYIWNHLRESKQQYRFVLTTDVRDVVFQSNPSKWLEDKLILHSLCASSEGMRYKNEPWGNKNYLDTFGPYFHNLIKDQYINNVGVIAGDQAYIQSLMLLIFQLSVNRPIPVVDQAVYNFILTTSPFLEDTFFTTNEDAWAIQLGTSIEAVKAGSGDLGHACKDNATEMAKYTMNYEDKQPVIDADGTVKTQDGKKYVVVHQWDRVPSLKTTIEKLYGEPNELSDGSRTLLYRTE